ncbi:MAG: hypothetical protein ACI33S_04260 [Bacilli bacterium]
MNEDYEKYKIKTNEKHNNGGTLYLINNLLYKYYGGINYFIEEKERNIDFLIKNPIPNTPQIIKKLVKDGQFCGYIMEYIPDSRTLREGMNEDIPEDIKISIIADIYQALRAIHVLGACLGDIHMDNFLFQGDKGFIIDLDEIRFAGDEFKFRECYLIREFKDSVVSKMATRITDNIKVAICCLSFLYQIDLEDIIINGSLQDVKEKLKSIIPMSQYETIEKAFDLNNLFYLDEIICNQDLNKRKI